MPVHRKDLAAVVFVAVLAACGSSSDPEEGRERVCGNGVVERGEACDDANRLDGDGCSADCASDETCGNLIIDLGEVCDDGGRVDGDGCSADCASDEACGNGVVDVGEVCDATAPQGGEGCSADCKSLLACGNGVVDPDEDCDGGPGGGTPTCTPGCRWVVCGDGVVSVEAGEECDAGVANSYSGSCLPDCRLAVCGDGARQVGVEDCDAGPDSAEVGHTCAPGEASCQVCNACRWEPGLVVH